MQSAKTYTIKGLADRLGKTRPTIYAMLKDGRFPIAPITGTNPRLWDAEKVEAWIHGPDNDTPQLSFDR